MSQRDLFAVAFISAVFLNLATAQAAPEKLTPEKLRVGVIASLTGEAASIGDACKNGIEFGLSKLKPEVRERLEVFYEDDQFAPQRSIAALNKLVENNKIQAVVNFSSGTGKALAPLTEEKRLPFISISTSPEISRDRKFAVNFWVTPETEAQAAFDEMKKRGYKTISRITSSQEGMLSIKEKFDALNKGDFKIVVDEEYSIDDKDFRTYVTKVRAKKEVDAQMIILVPAQLGVFARNFRQAGLTIPMFGFEAFEDSAAVKDAAGTLEGAWYINGADASPSFYEEFRKRYPNSSLWCVPSGYDTALILGKAVETSTDPAHLNQLLHTLKDFSGAQGTFSSTPDNRFTLPAEVKVIVNGGFKPLYD